jgi:hypothetical protein
MITQYKNCNQVNANNIINVVNQQKIAEMNQEFEFEDREIASTISQSIKCLMKRKEKRAKKNKRDKIERENSDEKLEHEKISNINIVEEKEDIENELFAVDY